MESLLQKKTSSSQSVFGANPNHFAEQNIYLDSHATTPVDAEVLNKMLPYFTEHYANGNHKAGWKTQSAMAKARLQVASLLGARPTEIIFTSGATESINLALLGLAKANPENRKHIVTQKTEHKAVLACVAALEEQGFRVSMLEVNEVGRIDLEELRTLVSEDTLVVAIMLANNEIGTIQPVKEIGEICHQSGAKFFCDLTQGLGWHPIQVDEMHIDLAAMSSHKIYGPRGVGALYLRRLPKSPKLKPILFGGGQEKGLRPGTYNIPAIVGFGKACEIQEQEGMAIATHIRKLRDRLQDHIFSTIEGVHLNGCPKQRHPANLNLAIPLVSGEDLIGALPEITFSTGSACTSASAKASHVITALGVEDAILKSSFRFGIGKFNTIEEIDYVGAQIVEKVKKITSSKSIMRWGQGF